MTVQGILAKDACSVFWPQKARPAWHLSVGKQIPSYYLCNFASINVSACQAMDDGRLGEHISSCQSL